VNDVSGSAELIGEGEAPGRQPVRVMEEQKLSHAASQASDYEGWREAAR
jgi:hypothetical protein